MARKRELDYMNAAACLLVVLIHVLSIGVTNVDRPSWQAVLLYVPWRLSAFVVPMFLYTGAVKMAWQYGDAVLSMKIYLRYVLRRFVKIYLPYAAWVAVYYFYFLRIGYVRGGVKEFVSYLLLGNLSSPFYYIVIVMQFYLLMPLWVWLTRHVQAYAAIGVSLLITLCMGQFASVLSHFGVEFLYMDRIFPAYLVFWMAGLYAGRHYDAVLPTVQERSTLGACVLVIAFCCGLSYRQYATGEVLFNLDQIKIFSDLSSIGLLHAAAWKLTASGSFLTTLLDKVHQASFSVYLSHCLFLTWVTLKLQDAGIKKLSLLLLSRFLICYTLPFLLYYALHWAASRWRKRVRVRL